MLAVKWPAIKVPAQYRNVQPISAEVVVLDYDHTAVVDIAPTSVLRLAMDWPAIKEH
jgi:hypothetical protein